MAKEKGERGDQMLKRCNIYITNVTVTSLERPFSFMRLFSTVSWD